jgi:ankyrin repeat protein
MRVDLAVFKNKQEIAELLLEKGADVNCQDLEGITPLHHVCFQVKKKKQISRYFLISGTDVCNCE